MILSQDEINKEIKKIKNNNVKKFLKKLKLRKVRGFEDESIEFMAPVTVLIGTNGGGKSTILGAAALAYKSTKPGQFFPKACIGDESMSEWSIEYEIIDKDISVDRQISRTARFAQSKWRRADFPERVVEYIEIERTVPAGELTRFRRFLAGDPKDFIVQKLSENTIKYAAAVLDKRIDDYHLVKMKDDPSSKMYTGVTNEKIGYSQFHFGAGEASVIEVIDRIENSPEFSLVLIEEIENGLHPIAVKQLVCYLQSAAKRLKLQIIFTTHSQIAVDELPSESVWASINKRTFNGKLSIESLRSITGETRVERAIYVEDHFVKDWVESAIRRHSPELFRGVSVFAAGGYPNVIKVSEFHNSNPMLKIKSIALVDGDIYDSTSPNKLPINAIYIGDGSPERIIFDFIFNNRIELVSIIRQRCLLSHFSEDQIIVAIESVNNSACDHHNIYSELSGKLGFCSALSIRHGLIDIFNEKNSNFWRKIIEFIEENT